MANYAVLVGINYPNTSSELRGCINDILLMNKLLREKYGFSEPANVRMLTDANATTQNILEHLEWLVSDCNEGDVLYFHYSGHGTQVIDLDYDTEEEPDGLDEIICPIDMNWRDRMITDDDFKRIFHKLPEGVNLTVVLDCCHSGGGLREILHPETPYRPRMIPMPPEIANKGYGLNLNPKPLGIEVKNDLQGILLSGSRSDQTAADTWVHGARRFHGAMTWQLAQTLIGNNYVLNHDALVADVQSYLSRDGFDQVPQLNCRPEYVSHQFLTPLP